MGIGEIVMNCEIKYKGQKYTTSFSDKLKLECIKSILFGKRCYRRVKVIIPQNIALYTLVSLCWICFGIFTYYFGQSYKAPKPYTIIDVIWDLKNPYFTSVILTLFITGYNQVIGYKEKLIQQHEFYCKCMKKFEQIFIPFIENKRFRYIVFYNDLCLKDTISFIENNGLWDFEKMSVAQAEVDEILFFLKQIEDRRKSKCILGIEDRHLNYDIENAEEILMSFKDIDKTDEAWDVFNTVVWSLLEIVEDLRRPWRWDIEDNVKILQILDKNDSNGIKEDFYYNMHLYGYDLYSEEE